MGCTASSDFGSNAPSAATARESEGTIQRISVLDPLLDTAMLANCKNESTWYGGFRVIKALEYKEGEPCYKYLTYLPEYAYQPYVVIDNFNNQENTTIVVPYDIQTGEKVIIMAPMVSHPLTIQKEELLKCRLEVDASKEYQELLSEAEASDLSDYDRTNCVLPGEDEQGARFVMFIPHLGYHHNRPEKSKEDLRKMLLLLLLAVHKISVEDTPYSIVYCDTLEDKSITTTPRNAASSSLLRLLKEQQTVYRLWKILPHNAKKNLVKAYVVHPAPETYTLFQLCHVFLSEKFFDKLMYIDTIASYYSLVSPKTLPIPTRYLHLEDKMLGLQSSGRMPPLRDTFEPALGCTRMMHDCMRHLRRFGLERVGIFRCSGDELLLQLVKNRLQFKEREGAGSDESTKAIIAANSKYVIIGNDNLPATRLEHSHKLHEGSHRSIHLSGSETHQLAPVLVTDLDTIAQILKLCIRDLPEPLVTPEAYQRWLELARQYGIDRASGGVCGASAATWLSQIFDEIECMPTANRCTLYTLLDFLHEVSEMSYANKMDVKNLAIGFTAVVTRMQATAEPMEALKEMKLCQIVLQALIAQPKRSVGAGAPSALRPAVETDDMQALTGSPAILGLSDAMMKRMVR